MNGYRRDTLLDASQQHNGVIEQEGAFGTLLLETNTIYEPLMSGSKGRLVCPSPAIDIAANGFEIRHKSDLFDSNLYD